MLCNRKTIRWIDNVPPSGVSQWSDCWCHSWHNCIWHDITNDVAMKPWIVQHCCQHCVNLLSHNNLWLQFPATVSSFTALWEHTGKIKVVSAVAATPEMEVELVELDLAVCLVTMATTESTQRQFRANFTGYLKYTSPSAFSKYIKKEQRVTAALK